MTISIHQQAFENYQAWAKSDRKIFARINTLIKEIIRNPLHRHRSS